MGRRHHNRHFPVTCVLCFRWLIIVGSWGSGVVLSTFLLRWRGCFQHFWWWFVLVVTVRVTIEGGCYLGVHLLRVSRVCCCVIALLCGVILLLIHILVWNNRLSPSPFATVVGMALRCRPFLLHFHQWTSGSRPLS